MGISTKHRLNGTLTSSILQGTVGSAPKLSGQLTIGKLSGGSVVAKRGLKGTLSKQSLRGDVDSTPKISGQLTIGTVIHDNHEAFDGNCVVTPSTSSEILLETADKIMPEDVRIKKIPYYDVSNETGGSTVYIGSEV